MRMRMIRIRSIDLSAAGSLGLVALLAASPAVPAAAAGVASADTIAATEAEGSDVTTVVIEATSTAVLAQMPGVSIDQNQQIHIRNTEGPQFQYQINGVLIPLDINTNPPFLSMFNPAFIKRLDLLDGVLPSRYSYATGGVVNIETRDGCEQPLRDFSLRLGQRETLEPSFEYAGCHDGLGSYVSALYQQSNSAFSSATAGPVPIHDRTWQGQALGFFSHPVGADNTLSLLLSGASSRNQLPNVPGLA